MGASSGHARSDLPRALAVFVVIAGALSGCATMAAPTGRAPVASPASSAAAPSPGETGLAAIRNLTPDPAFSPTQVVQIQLVGMKLNDPAGGDLGLSIAFGFASPHQRGERASLDRFRQVVRTPPYRPLLNHQRALIKPAPIRGERAEVTVTVIDERGLAHGYRFRLVLQRGGELDGCWLTEGVVPMPLTEDLLLV